MIDKKNFVIIISGPTATGKSDFALQLGENVPIEIVNADIGSFYKQLSIGTAKPDWQREKIAHHFFDILDTPINYTAPQFRDHLKLLIEQIWDRGNIPVVVGGSAFYIQSFFYRNHELITPDQELINKLEMQPVEILWKELDTIDPDRAKKIHINDRYRLVRALAIWHTQRQKPSEFEQIFDPIAPFYFIHLTRDRNQLYDMINKRVNSMIAAGWVNEVSQIIDSCKTNQNDDWVNFLHKKKMIGYDLLIEYLQANCPQENLSDVIDLIMQRTRNYAKRQNTFLHKLIQNIEKNKICHKNYHIQLSVIELCNLTLCDLSLYIKQLSERILQFLK